MHLFQHYLNGWFTDWSPCVREHFNPPCWKKKKEESLYLRGLGTPPPPPSLRPSSNHSVLLATSLMAHCPTAFVLCVYVGVCVCCNIATPRLCTFLRVACIAAGRGVVSHPYSTAIERKHCEAFCFPSLGQEGKGWEHQQVWVLSLRSLFQCGRWCHNQ